MTPLVSTSWLADRLGDGCVVLDATYYLPNENQDARGKFQDAHIPGAQFFDIDAISDKTTDLPHMLPAPQEFAAAVAALGVSNSSQVVVYDQRGIFSAARVWWMFRVFGHDEVAVLDGGLPKWLAEGRNVTATLDAPQPGRFTPAFRPAMRRQLQDMRLNLEQKAELVLDARGAGRFNGSIAEPRAGMKSGHIPGARSLPFTELLQNGAMLPPEALRKKFAAAGVDGSKPVVTSCGSGVTAAVLTLGLVVSGLPAGAIYDGSWSEWGSRNDTPIEV